MKNVMKVKLVECYKVESKEYPELFAIGTTQTEAIERLEVLIYEHRQMLRIAKEVQKLAYQ
ncbi:hypothetical protein M2475_000914 [Breznakia sp. PF5-3]|uniref:hypothetical protein n=1 Tax=unclassified Breznakia TaxID=2623764 RepID=UPI0024049DC0|nr:MULTISPECIES: hypothetical protein [unclassified Breznakia]MDL2276164.1 hypothetical protein [Breznakia sp. OttesenSCG-928-G09]MDF9824686.1 hypothetical protein [Breznakia sp. PM6-1]MDF9835349.1 hypothetical protein [Breznakia sp. PF5-3]MDF9836948.1 hypothetical protein [Breznakia sp. PFB2-8]MDF9859584.1 hypothetical protein [Breznakia sp. PH5-24]